MRKNLAVLLTIGLIIGTNVFVFESLQDRNTAIERQKPQCSHWCLVTTAALLGLPMSIDHAMKRLPPDPAGHSLLAVKQSLAKVGIRCVGKRVSMKDIETTKFPAIVHLQEPLHFVVAIRAEHGLLTFFDTEGRRSSERIDRLKNRWTGYLLEEISVEAYERVQGPAIRFGSLIQDCGSNYLDGKTVKFSFPFQNTGSEPVRISDV